MTDGATPVAKALAARIAREGPLPLDVAMADIAAAYYAKGDVIGAAGDFTTAPEISQVFGELIGLWCAVTWQRMGSPAAFRLVECGPGRGTLMADLLRASAKVPGFGAAADIHLIEQSPALRARQRETLKTQQITWHDAVDGVPTGPTILVANEFLDALPIKQFVRTAQGWTERHLDARDGAFVFVDLICTVAPSPQPLSPEGRGADSATRTFELPLPYGERAGVRGFVPSEFAVNLPVGSIVEHAPAVEACAREIAARVRRDGGAALVIDYGYVGPASGDTLQAVKAHRFHPVLEDIGSADLTAHVDFGAVKRMAEGAGARVFGPEAQGTWLAQLGLSLRVAQLARNKPAEDAARIAAAAKRLSAPDGMGLLFKVLAIAHPSLAQMDGFAQDGAP